MRLVLDGTSRRLDDGRVLIAGSPLTLFRLGPAGVHVVDAIASGHEVAADAGALVDRLLDTGAAHPRPAGTRFDASDVTVVVPVRDHDPGPTVAGLGRTGAVLVVDDGSRQPVVTDRGTVVRHPRPLGPAAARMTGAARAVTPLVAFVDADCEPTPGWLDPLLAHFDDDRVALVTPRVVSVDGRGVIARYEAGRSPLDLGPREGRIAPGTRVSYAPAAAVVVRRAAFEDVGGFDTALATGEDVDLVWRLVRAGWRARYEPRSRVGHRPRPSLAGFVRQRFGYGCSAAPLEDRHPGAVAPVVIGPAAAVGWALAALGWPVAGFLVGMSPAATLRDALPHADGRDRVAVALALQGLVRAGEQLASATVRLWWPIALPAAVAVRPLRRTFLAAALLPSLLDWSRTLLGPPTARLDPLRYLALRLLDDASYGAGVWVGVLRAGDLGALRLRLTGPGRPVVGPPLSAAPRAARRRAGRSGSG